MTNYIIHDITTKATFKKVLEKLEGMGVRWQDGDNLTGDIYIWDKYKKKTCLCVEDKELTYGTYKLLKTTTPYSSHPFITAKDFLKGKKVEEPINLDGKIMEIEGNRYKIVKI
jgi:hypothetical protein